MAGPVTVKVHGLQEIQRALAELGPTAANRAARSALNKAATPVVKRARELAPTPGDPDDPYATGALSEALALAAAWIDKICASCHSAKSR
jgi:hypothetical protein